METIIIIPENKKQSAAIKSFLKAVNIRFRTEKEDDALMTEEEFYAKIVHAIKQAEEGKVVAVTSLDELHKHLDSL